MSNKVRTPTLLIILSKLRVCKFQVASTVVGIHLHTQVTLRAQQTAHTDTKSKQNVAKSKKE